MSSDLNLTIILEKKGRGRSIMKVRPWSIRMFKLSGQTLEYFDGVKLKGVVNTADSITTKLLPEQAEGKSFPFKMELRNETLIFNASSDIVRDNCISIFNASAELKLSKGKKTTPTIFKSLSTVDEDTKTTSIDCVKSDTSTKVDENENSYITLDVTSNSTGSAGSSLDKQSELIEKVK
jgi:hypothetical protein